MKRRTGWRRVEKKVESLRATRSTGSCRRAISRAICGGTRESDRIWSNRLPTTSITMWSSLPVEAWISSSRWARIRLTAIRPVRPSLYWRAVAAGEPPAADESPPRPLRDEIAVALSAPLIGAGVRAAARAHAATTAGRRRVRRRRSRRRGCAEDAGWAGPGAVERRRAGCRESPVEPAQQRHQLLVGGGARIAMAAGRRPAGRCRCALPQPARAVLSRAAGRRPGNAVARARRCAASRSCRLRVGRVVDARRSRRRGSRCGRRAAGWRSRNWRAPTSGCPAPRRCAPSGSPVGRRAPAASCMISP